MEEIEEKKYVGYFRQGNKKRGRSLLDLDNQMKAVFDQRKRKGGALIRSFFDNEDEKRKKRPEFKNALKYCKENDAALIIAQMGNLSKNATFLQNLKKSNVNFFVCDVPSATHLTIDKMILDAAERRERVSANIKAPLAKIRDRGVQLGINGKVLAHKNREEAYNFAINMLSTIEELHSNGFYSLRAIKKELNRRNVPTPRNKKWHLRSVQRLLKRLKEIQMLK